MMHRILLPAARIQQVAALLTLGLCLRALPGCAQGNPTQTTRTQNAPVQVSQATAQEYVWWEAENPKATNFPARTEFAPANAQEASVLSQGQWIGTGGDRNETYFLEYDVTVPKTGKYSFYARKFWQHGPFRWRFDNGAWTEVRNTALLDEAPIRQFVVANWVTAGTADLTQGQHTLRIELLQNTGAAAFDAFVLTMQPFNPRGKLKPGEKYNRAPQGWFPFEPDADTFKASPIDLRVLNEKFAGANGFIQARGDKFVHGNNNQIVRFWAVNAGGGLINLDQASVDYLARYLAKRGVNMVRIHGGIWGDDFRQVNPEFLDKYFYFVAAMKRQGIYTNLSIYFPLWLQFRENSGFDGYPAPGTAHPFALLFFNPEFQQIYRNWWRTLLTTKNPYTGLALRDDPAVAVAEIVNEDSYLFWTFSYNNIPAPQMALLEKQFGDWLTGKYGSTQAALTKWNSPDQHDNLAQGRVGFMPLGTIKDVRNLRAQDTATFLTEHQKKFFEDTISFLRKDLGYKALIHGSNWVTADARVLGPLDKYSNTVADFMDRHGYYGGLHEGERASYSVSKGDKYDDRAAVTFDPEKAGSELSFGLPIMDIQYNGKPSTISELNWTPPNRFRADMPLLSAAYGALQGTDGFFFFALSGPSWQEVLGKFSIQTPVGLGQFPAAALLYRKGMVQEGGKVVDVQLKLSDLQALKGTPVSAPLNLDEFRARDIPAGKTAPVDEVKSIDPLAFLVGKVAMTISQQGGKSQVADLPKFIDRKAQVVKSQSGQLTWEYGNGKVLVNAPQAQAVTGFLRGAGAVQLKDVTFNSPMDFGTIMLVSLDAKPLATSSRMLLQVMAEENNYGWETSAAEGVREITNLGSAPLVVRNLQGTVSLKRADAAQLKVTALDFNGYPKQRLAKNRIISLSPSTIYYLIEK
jgi:hypothetical protein